MKFNLKNSPITRSENFRSKRKNFTNAQVGMLNIEASIISRLFLTEFILKLCLYTCNYYKVKQIDFNTKIIGIVRLGIAQQEFLIT